MLVVRDYFAMLEKELRGEDYSKAAYRRKLRPLLQDRSESSVEYKHQNISAVLIRVGHVYIEGYKPKWNYQQLLRDTVMNQLIDQQARIVELEQWQMETVPSDVPNADWAACVKVPEGDPNVERRYAEIRKCQHQGINFAEREAKCYALGECGEKYVLELERIRLKQIGRADLVNEIEWTSKHSGDGAGYDIRSFDDRGEQERFIEVKTTNAGEYQPFCITQNEVAFSEQNAPNYMLYRVFNFYKSAKFYQLHGNVKDKMILESMVYRASLSN